MNGNINTSASKVDLAIESVMDMIDAIGNFALISRGALGIDNGLCCEIAPSTPETVFLDKNAYFPIVLALNGKHADSNKYDERNYGHADPEDRIFKRERIGNRGHNERNIAAGHRARRKQYVADVL